MRTTQFDGREVFLTEGAIVDGVKIAGIFEHAHDASHPDADSLALGTVAWDKLTPEQKAIATENSNSL